MYPASPLIRPVGHLLPVHREKDPRQTLLSSLPACGERVRGRVTASDIEMVIPTWPDYCRHPIPFFVALG
ncbi:hypothetical protein ADU59_17045 [Pararhizobium polonicum]|uniref:Uncharacterized protein n=1 Tax=Pararhizobium polonicum TaxID=1612624 RepID=A0A1C7NZC9_9HYPH|nr:hypothetical protein ADU59_17045 [Pararhizobium polonicum]